MKPVEILQGKWLGHPVHPAVVHLPLALWIGAALLDVLVLLDIQVVTLSRLAFYAVLLGLLGALVAIPTGIADWLPIKSGKPARRLGRTHMVLNLVATGLFAANFLLRLNALEAPRPVTLPIAATSLLGAAVIAFSGYLGSLLVFEHGISVARLSKGRWREEAIRGGSNVPPKT